MQGGHQDQGRPDAPDRQNDKAESQGSQGGAQEVRGIKPAAFEAGLAPAPDPKPAAQGKDTAAPETRHEHDQDEAALDQVVPAMDGGQGLPAQDQGQEQGQGGQRPLQGQQRAPQEPAAVRLDLAGPSSATPPRPPRPPCPP